MMPARMRPILIFCLWCVIISNAFGGGFVVRKENRKTLVSTENGEIAAARVGDGASFSYLLHFFTMDPNSLFLPVILHSDMVFYVHTGSGKLSWTEENELKTTDLRRGDVYRLKEGAVFFIQSNLETEAARQRLRIHAIFPTDLHEPPTGPYSSIRDMVLGFDRKVLQAAFKVSEAEIEELLSGAEPPAIIHQVSRSHRRGRELETEILGSLMGSRSYNVFELNKKKGKKSGTKSFNLFKEDKDFENGNGWSTTVTGKKLSALKDTGIGVFMVNLTMGSMMGPHWNPVATEIAVVLQGRGMVRVVCPRVLNGTGCSNGSFEVEEGDVFVVPRFHPMAQMGFNNETFVFMGFSSSEKKNHPQYLAGQASVLRTLNKDVLAMSFNARNTTMDQLLDSQEDSVILGCISCAEQELKILEEEKEREREDEEAREREEEEERRREEEEEEEAREREREREEEERKKQEEEEERRKREEEEEEAKREEEERKRQEEEEEAREREEEEAKREEEERKRREEEEERRREEEEEAEREEEERRRREEEEAREREEEEARREEKERKRHKEEEEARREEEEIRRKEEEAREREEERRRREEEARREEEQTRREEEERERWEEEEEEEERKEQRRKRRQEEAAEEEEMARKEEEERQRQEEERWEEEEERHDKRGRRGEEEAGRQHEEERETEEQRGWE